jgi:mxaJ protein
MRASDRLGHAVASVLIICAGVAIAVSEAAAQSEGAPQGRGGSEPAGLFRVCADPNNLPFSNAAKEGLENRLAELFARELGETVAYTWHAQRRGFVRETLKAKQCDVVMGMPVKLDMIEATKPYYRSGYVFVSRTDRHLDIQSVKDPRLKSLKIGVQIIGDDGFNTPPSHALSAQGIVDNLVGYTVYGNYSDPNPASQIITAVERGDVDIAAVWGPLAGYFAKHARVPLTVSVITGTESFAPLLFEYDIGMGLRKGDHARRDQLNQIIERKRPEIGAILTEYGVPLLPLDAKSSEAAAGRGLNR